MVNHDAFAVSVEVDQDIPYQDAVETDIRWWVDQIVLFDCYEVPERLSDYPLAIISWFIEEFGPLFLGDLFTSFGFVNTPASFLQNEVIDVGS